MKVSRSARAVGSQFSLTMREALVCGRKRKHMPSCTPQSRNCACTVSVISCRPLPRVGISRVVLCQFTASQRDNKCRSLIQFTFYMNLPTQFFHNGFDNIQSNPATGDFGDGNILGPIKSLEQMLHGFSRNTEPLI